MSTQWAMRINTSPCISYLLSALLLLVVICLAANSAWAQTVGASGAGDLPRDQQVSEVRADWRGGLGYGPQPLPIDARGAELPYFGAQLFAGGFRGVRADDLSPGYRVMPGDRVTLRVWGALELDRELSVDSQGNIFIPSVGPVAVQGVTHEQLDARVRAAVRSIYPDNVHVYTNLQGIQPVAVFVTGFVHHPGRYAGTPNDAILFFLDQAGGIDEALGSYRDIRVVRNGTVIARSDLYHFMLAGQLERPQFRDGDTLIVGPRGPVVSVTGDVQRPYRYELPPDQLTGEHLLTLARLQAGVSHVLLRGERPQGPISAYHPLSNFATVELHDGDELYFSADRRSDTIIVQVEGSYFGPSRYAVPRDATLRELLDAIAVPMARTDVNSISLRRVSVAERQRQSLQDSLRRLETTYLSAPSATSEEAQIRVQEAEMISNFVQRAAQIEPTGRLVLAHNGRITNVRLQDGDIITIPERSDALLISGEVLVPQSMVFTPGRSVRDYINAAGGFTQQADRSNVLVVRQNGEVREASGIRLRPGDEILVLPTVPTKNLQLATSLSQILFQIAVAAKVVLDI